MSSSVQVKSNEQRPHQILHDSPPGPASNSMYLPKHGLDLAIITVDNIAYMPVTFFIKNGDIYDGCYFFR